jgi:putative membrane protein
MTTFANPLELRIILATVLYAAMGGFMLVGLFWLIDKIIPTHIWRGIVEEKNQALAIVVAGFVIALGLIVAAAIG